MKLHPHNGDACRPLSYCQRTRTVLALLLIVLAIVLNSLTNHILPCLPEVYQMPVTDTSVFCTCSGVVSTVKNNWMFISLLFFMLVVLLLPSCYWNEPSKWSRIIHLNFTSRLKRKPLKRGQPLYKGQMVHPQCVLCSEVLLYYTPRWELKDQRNITPQDDW